MNEDEDELQHLPQEALRDAGFDFTSAVSGEQAVTLLKSGVIHYRAPVTDIKLDGHIGEWEVARQARLIDPAFPVVYMTGGHGGELPVQGVPNSVLLHKPFAPAQLITAISQLLNVGTSMLGPPQPSP
ncbi:response regulator [Bradyrhizobium sp. BR 1432]|uniref:response regulator n=1 Tax=Bradyrhizobium sp. BR 1432 TaxID=3447966 RepID=UPI003EE4D8DF